MTPQATRAMACTIMGHPAVMALFQTELVTTIERLVAAKDVEDIRVLQAQAQFLQRMLADIERVKKQVA